MTEPDAAELLIQAEKCPLIRGAYASGEATVIARMEKDHPPERCIHVKQAAAESSG